MTELSHIFVNRSARDDADTMIEDSRREKIRKLLILGFAIRVRPEVVFFKIVRD
jgi:hypothetical protein